MEIPMVSIIIPVYNCEKFLNQCLDSFFNQTFQNFEIICVNDGSTDTSTSIIENYTKSDSRIQLYNQENKGAGVARNTGMKYARGKYLYFFDSDDYCEPDLLEKLISKAEETSSDITVLDYFKIDEETGNITEFKGLNNSLYPQGKDTFCYLDVPNRILSIVNPTPWNKLFRRDFVMQTGLEFMPLSTTNDITFCALTVAMADRISYVREPLMYYRINRNNSITSLKSKRLGNIIKAVKEVEIEANNLPYADKIHFSIMYFIMDNLIFALNNYAGDFISPDYKEYYKEIHQIFNEELFADVFEDKINNKKLFEQYKDIRDNSYEEKNTERIKQNIKNRIKKIFFPLLGVKIKRFEDRSREIIDKQNQIINKQNQSIERQKKDIQRLTKQYEDSKSRENLLLSRINGDIQRLNAMKKQLTAMELVIYGKSYGLNTNKRHPSIIVSMTSFPARIKYVPYTLERLMNQTVKPDKIVLWLSKDQFPNRESDLPYRLIEMQSRGLEIEWCDEDLKAYKKILPALEKYPDDLIITVDDDLVYDVDLIENLYEGYRKFPDSIIASRAHKITYDEFGNLEPYQCWEKEICEGNYISQNNLFFTGGAGTLYPPTAFGSEVFNIDNIKKLCPLADDIWLNIMARLQGTKIVLTGSNSRLTYVEGTQDERLYDVNIDANDAQLQKLLTFYNVNLNDD